MITTNEEIEILRNAVDLIKRKYFELEKLDDGIEQIMFNKGVIFAFNQLSEHINYLYHKERKEIRQEIKNNCH